MYMFTPFPLLKSLSDAQDNPGGQGDTNSPLVAITTVVSTFTMSVCGPPTLLSIPPRPAVTAGIYLKWQVVPSAQIAAFLYELFDTHGLSPQTIKGYRSCLASVLSCTGKAAAV